MGALFRQGRLLGQQRGKLAAFGAETLVEHGTFLVSTRRLAEGMDVSKAPPVLQAPMGAYQLIRKGETPPEHARIYRLTHPLGQYVLDTGRNLPAPLQSLTFHYGSHKPRISMVERLVGVRPGTDHAADAMAMAICR